MSSLSHYICLFILCAATSGCTGSGFNSRIDSDDISPLQKHGWEQGESDIDNVLHDGMNQEEAFSALGVTYRRERIFGSNTRTHHFVQCERYPGKEIQLDFYLTWDGMELGHWTLFDELRTADPSDWIRVDTKWARKADERIAEILKSFAEE